MNSKYFILILGIAIRGGACSRARVGLVYDTVNFFGIKSTIHELGHLYVLQSHKNWDHSERKYEVRIFVHTDLVPSMTFCLFAKNIWLIKRISLWIITIEPKIKKVGHPVL